MSRKPTKTWLTPNINSRVAMPAMQSVAIVVLNQWENGNGSGSISIEDGGIQLTDLAKPCNIPL